MDLPAEVISEIQANRKIAAIKLLREHESMGLKEAKQAVDAYMAKHPGETSHQSKQSQGIGRVVFAVLVLGLVYSLYKYFA